MEPLRQLFWHLEHRRSLYVPASSYTALTTFLAGYLLAWRDIRHDDINQRFQAWLQALVGRHFSIGWAAYIREHLADNDEQAATQQLFQLWGEFLAADVA